MNGIPDLMASFGNNISDFNRDTRSIGASLRARGEDPGNLSPKLFATYDYFSLDNGIYIRYIEIMENQYNDRIYLGGNKRTVLGVRQMWQGRGRQDGSRVWCRCR